MSVKATLKADIKQIKLIHGGLKLFCQQYKYKTTEKYSYE